MKHRTRLQSAVVLSVVVAALSGATAWVATSAAWQRQPAPTSARPHTAADPTELVVVFQRQKDPTQVRADADRFAQALSRELGMPVSATVPVDYSASVQALVSRKADLAYVSAMPFLLARRDGGARILLAESRRSVSDGAFRTSYDSVWVVAADSPLQSYDDLLRSARTLRLAFTSPTSTSGYIMPLARFVTEGVVRPGQDPREVFGQVAFGGSYTAALEQVLLGRADAAAVSDYVMEGEKADVYLPAEKRQRLRVLSRTPGVPTHVLAVRGGLSEAFVGRLREAVLKVAREEPELLAAVYGATRLVEVDEDAHVRAAVEAIERTGIPVEGLAR